MQSRAHFSYKVEGDLIVITDTIGPISVTMDAERVLADIQNTLGSLEGKYIIYRDTNGAWDSLEWYQNNIQIFPLGADSVEDAVTKLRIHLEKKGLHWSQQDNDQMQRQSDEGNLRQYEN